MLKGPASLTQETVLILKRTENLLQNSAKVSLKNSDILSHSVSDTRDKISKMLEQSKESILRQTNQAIKEAIETQTANFEKRLNHSGNEVEASAARLNRQSNDIAQQTKFLMWKSLTVLTLGCCLMVGSTFWLAWNKLESFNQINDRYENMVLHTEIKEKTKNMKITTCDGRACIKVNESLKKYGNNGETYMIIAE